MVMYSVYGEGPRIESDKGSAEDGMLGGERSEHSSAFSTAPTQVESWNRIIMVGKDL